MFVNGSCNTMMKEGGVLENQEQVLALYEGFESCNVRVLWSLKAGLRFPFFDFGVRIC